MKSTLQKITGALLLVVVVWLFGGCHETSSVNSSEQIVGSGRLVTRSASVVPFTGIDLTGIGEVYVTQDSMQSVRLEADDNIIDRLLVGVQNGNLTIGIEQGSYSQVTIKIYVSAPMVKFLQVTGAGSFASVGPLETSTLTTRIVGAGSVTLSGRAASHVVELEGTGSVHGFNFESSSCSVMLSGTGTAEVNVTQHLEATITGIGSVIYAGDPPEVSSNITGLGSLKRR